ncbi:hypothetical protein HPB51_020375 [Rhipicephalus microplus]|uniref:Uncharacterized protein n=1 Tax=Rhipicephalus microplus TaxID=6941 RepID=A0A9J6DW30_RHIMP|nr:hypothetical protein HPB51_020375 [Rhipicephalus microplus]
MLPFLATALDGLLRSLLGRIVLKEKLDAAGTFSKLIKIDLENPNNIIGIAAFDIGLAAKSELRKITKPSHTAVVSVKKECILFIKACSAKIIERSPLKYKLTRGASCLNSAVCAASVEAGQKQLNIALEVLIEHGRLIGLQGERASRSYVQVCSNSTAQVRFRKFDRARERLEKLWVELCASSHEELLLFVKIVLCLSHGNSSVERGFSVNKECLVENMKEESLVAQRLVYDEVSAAGGVAEVDVTDKMIDMVRSSNIKWKEDLERKKKERLDVLDAERKKKRTAALVKELESKKQKLMEDAQLQVSMLQQEIESLKQHEESGTPPLLRTVTQTLKVRWLDELLEHKTISCPIQDCPFSCPAITAMEKHYSQCTGVNGSGLDQCPYCEAQFLTHSSALHVHIVEQHPTRRSLMHSQGGEGRKTLARRTKSPMPPPKQPILVRPTAKKTRKNVENQFYWKNTYKSIRKCIRGISGCIPFLFLVLASFLTFSDASLSDHISVYPHTARVDIAHAVREARVYALFSVPDSIGAVIVHRAYAIRGTRLVHSTVDDNISTRAASVHAAQARGIVYGPVDVIR